MAFSMTIFLWSRWDPWVSRNASPKKRCLTTLKIAAKTVINWCNSAMTPNVDFSLHIYARQVISCAHITFMRLLCRLCGLVDRRSVNLWGCGLADLWTLWTLWTCGLRGPVDSLDLWTCGLRGPVYSVDLWTCGSADFVDLWTCGPVDSMDLCTWGNGLTHGLNCCLVSYFVWLIAFWN